MPKSKIRFNDPETFTPCGVNTMRECQCGNFVHRSDYSKLLRAYLGALAQLDRVAERISNLRKGRVT